MPPCPPQVAGSQEGFQVRAHDIFHPTNSSAVKEFVHVERFSSTICLESFQGDLEPDLVAVLEAVGDGFFRAVDAEGDSTHLVNLYSFGKSIARKPEETDRRICETGRFRTLLDRHSNLTSDFDASYLCIANSVTTWERSPSITTLQGGSSGTSGPSHCFQVFWTSVSIVSGKKLPSPENVTSRSGKVYLDHPSAITGAASRACRIEDAISLDRNRLELL